MPLNTASVPSSVTTPAARPLNPEQLWLAVTHAALSEDGKSVGEWQFDDDIDSFTSFDTFLRSRYELSLASLMIHVLR